METLLPEGERIFRSQNVSSWTLQQDNDPSHKKACMIVDAYNREHHTKITLLESWPPSSPDLSPIENLWGIVQARLDAKGCKTFAEFQSAVHNEWQSVTRHLSMSLLLSIRSRVAKCIQNRGKSTEYWVLAHFGNCVHRAVQKKRQLQVLPNISLMEAHVVKHDTSMCSLLMRLFTAIRFFQVLPLCLVQPVKNQLCAACKKSSNFSNLHVPYFTLWHVRCSIYFQLSFVQA